MEKRVAKLSRAKQIAAKLRTLMATRMIAEAIAAKRRTLMATRMIAEASQW